MGRSFSQIVAKRAAMRVPGFGVETRPGLQTYDQLMRNKSSAASRTKLPGEQLLDNNIGTLNGDNLETIDGNNLVRIS